MIITGVQNGSVADELGIEAGDELTAFDGYAVVDVLDYEYYNSRSAFTMTVSRGGEVTEFDVEKDDDEDLGLEFDGEIETRQCRNRCIFCFVSQLPRRELRKTLRVRDDDYRHSFISGNYITMTNLSEEDLARIERLKLSPLYISVHSTDDAVRRKLLGNARAPSLLPQMRRLKAAGIVMHTQIVYCPGFNDDLAKSIDDLKGLAASLAIVPVGLTRDCNPVLKPVGRKEAEAVIGLVERAQERLLPEVGTRFVFAADEFYVKAGRPVPPAEHYENFDQIENGVGLMARFSLDFSEALSRISSGTIRPCAIATGESAAPFIRQKADELTARFGGKIAVYPVRNDFFGPSVTVAGLLTGGDIAAQLGGKPLGERLVIPRCMLREFHDVFLDDMTVAELSRRLGVPVTVAGSDGASFVETLVENV